MGDQGVAGAVLGGDRGQALGVPLDRLLGPDGGDVRQVPQGQHQRHQAVHGRACRPCIAPGVGVVPQHQRPRRLVHGQDQEGLAGGLGKGQGIVDEKPAHVFRLETEIQGGEIAHGGRLLLGDREILDVGRDLVAAELRQPVAVGEQGEALEQAPEGAPLAVDQRLPARRRRRLRGHVHVHPRDFENVGRLRPGGIGPRPGGNQHTGDEREKGRLAHGEKPATIDHCKPSRIQYLRPSRTLIPSIIIGG